MAHSRNPGALSAFVKGPVNHQKIAFMEISGAMKQSVAGEARKHRAAAPSLHIEKWDPPEIPEATDSSSIEE